MTVCHAGKNGDILKYIFMSLKNVESLALLIIKYFKISRFFA